MTTIVEDAFASCEKVVIYGYKNSKAEEYAKENEIEFVEIKDDDETVVQTETPIPTQNVQVTPTVEPSVQPDSTIPQENTILTNTKNKCQVKVLSNATENPTVAYEKCTNLKKITLKSKVLTTVEKNVLKGTNKKLVIKVLKGKVSVYKKLFQGKGNTNVVVK